MCPPPNVAATTAAAKAPMVGIGVNAQMVIKAILMFQVDAKVFLLFKNRICMCRVADLPSALKLTDNVRVLLV